MLDPSVRLEGDYEQHKNKANTTAGKETMLRRICESARHLQKCRFQR